MPPFWYGKYAESRRDWDLDIGVSRSRFGELAQVLLHDGNCSRVAELLEPCGCLDVGRVVATADAGSAAAALRPIFTEGRLVHGEAAFQQELALGGVLVVSHEYPLPVSDFHFFSFPLGRAISCFNLWSACLRSCPTAILSRWFWWE